MDPLKMFHEDERSRFILGRICAAFKITQDKLDVGLKEDESRQALSVFLAGRSPRVIFGLNNKGIVICSLDSFTKGKKGVVVYKFRDNQPDDPKDFIASLAFVDIPKNPIGFMHRMTDNVYSPIAKTDANVSRFAPPFTLRLRPVGTILRALQAPSDHSRASCSQSPKQPSFPAAPPCARRFPPPFSRTAHRRIPCGHSRFGTSAPEPCSYGESNT